MSRLSIALALLAAATKVFAQTTTSCNPLNATCPADPALGTTFNQTFDATTTGLSPDYFEFIAGESLVSFSDAGAAFTISEQGQSVTAKTKFYMLFGTVEMIFQASSGQGIISTFAMYSDDLDEIDVEIESGVKVSNNYYGWGNLNQTNGEYPQVSWSPSDGLHNYTVVWSETSLDWIFDGANVRSVPYQAPGLWPQTPSFLQFGIWAGGDPSEPNGTITWAGGKTNYADGPFTMTIKSITMTDAHQNVSSYSYGDNSGSWQSIDVKAGQSAVYNDLNKVSEPKKIAQQWNGLSTGAKIGIAAGVGGAVLVAFIAFLIYCFRQRKSGRLEREAADRLWDQQNSELMEYRKQMAHGNFAVSYLSMRPGEKF